jgi:basic membrane lipoprotein Med (substrate-binding protein (PBP1-ABC) superfamily)
VIGYSSPMRRPLALIFALAGALAGLLATACSDANKKSDPDEFKVALLSPGPVSDNGWNASAYEGLLRIKKDLGAVIAQQEVKTPAEFEEGYRRNAERGAKLIFGHGFEFGDWALKVGKEFPSVAFVVSAGAPTAVANNVASMVWRIEDAAYLCGRIAASVSKTGKAGCVGGQDIPPLHSAFDAFAAGAKSANPNFEVRAVYIGDWHNIGAAKAQSISLVEAGCDTLFHDADAAGLGVLEAATEKGIFAFGCTNDQSPSAPKAVLASATVDVPGSFVAIAKEVKEGRFKGRRIEWTRKDGFVKLVWNPALRAKIPADVVKAVEELDAKIASGELKVPYSAP